MKHHIPFGHVNYYQVMHPGMSTLVIVEVNKLFHVPHYTITSHTDNFLIAKTNTLTVDIHVIHFHC